MLAIYMLYGIVVRQKINLSQLRGHRAEAVGYSLEVS